MQTSSTDALLTIRGIDSDLTLYADHLHIQRKDLLTVLFTPVLAPLHLRQLDIPLASITELHLYENGLPKQQQIQLVLEGKFHGEIGAVFHTTQEAELQTLINRIYQLAPVPTPEAVP